MQSWGVQFFWLKFRAMSKESRIELQIAGKRIPFDLIPTRGRRLGIRYHAADGVFQIKSPGAVWNEKVERFVRSNEAWILKHLPLIEADQFRQSQWWDEVKAGKLTLCGQTYDLTVSAARQASFLIEDGKVVLKGPQGADIRELMFLGLFRYAKEILPQLVRRYAAQTRMNVNRVVVKQNLRSKWGSASSLGNLNLNWLIILLPEEYIRYLIIHELMHFHEMNHSPKFWAWVEQYEPNYQYLDQSLKDWGWVFGLFGK